ncbi:MAG: 50S ribosomal protein L29 [Candidatus Methylacidiphilales bacterium]|nr:50S ribosomal protein L29 [Candidatus Methylacidiphilales bacterium]
MPTDIIEFRDLTVDELKAKDLAAREETFNLRLQQATGTLERPSRLRELRKERARIHTAISEKALGLTIKRKEKAK